MGVKAVVIEPRRSVFQQITDVLEHQNVAVESVTQPVLDADQILASQPDLLLLNIEMPKLDGIELARAIRAHMPNVPIMFLTGHPVLLTVQNAAQHLGATVFQTKPFNRNELARRIRDAMAHGTRPLTEGPSSVFDSLMAHLLPDLHDPTTGRLDARRVADYLSISLSSLASALGKSAAAVHKSPAAISLQEGLAPIARSLAVLSRLLRSQDKVLAWLNSKHPDLGNETPLSLILAGKATAVADLLESVLAGQPS
jgi:DNA-binding response OmpR family regulator